MKRAPGAEAVDLRKLMLREDGWPLCPVCGEDDLASLNPESPTIADDLLCFRCDAITVARGQGWPICAKCDKGVDRYERADTLDHLIIKLYCHGGVQSMVVDRSTGLTARLVCWGKAFSDMGPLEIRE
jgi:hypothetical protein